jgi:hypothetical protein
MEGASMPEPCVAVAALGLPSIFCMLWFFRT